MAKMKEQKVIKIDPANLNRVEAHALLVGAIGPRPIAFVSTVGQQGINNLAPFSFFTALSVKPAIVGFAVARKRAGQKKDTLINIEETKEFVINVVTEELAQAMNLTSGEYAYEVDEFKVANLTPAPSDLIKAPRVAESPLNLECKLLQILEFGQFPTLTSFIIGEVLRVHIQEEVCVDGVIKALKLKAIGRLGEDFYCKTRDIFEMKRPTGPF